MINSYIIYSTYQYKRTSAASLLKSGALDFTLSRAVPWAQRTGTPLTRQKGRLARRKQKRRRCAACVKRSAELR